MIEPRPVSITTYEEAVGVRRPSKIVRSLNPQGSAYRRSNAAEQDRFNASYLSAWHLQKSNRVNRSALQTGIKVNGVTNQNLVIARQAELVDELRNERSQ